jgi:hypothetical protein
MLATIPSLKKPKLSTFLSKLPDELSDAIESEYQELTSAYLLRDWSSVQTYVGRLAEAALRVLEWHETGAYTSIDDQHKPNRSQVVGAARNNTSLPPTLRLQIPAIIELMMDFRNNRNSAHLGKIKPWHLDAATVTQISSWLVAELIRLETKMPHEQIQTLIDNLAELPSPIIQRVSGVPIVLNDQLGAEERALVILFDEGAPIDARLLCEWSEYANTSRWFKQVLPKLIQKRQVHMDKEGVVHLLRPGELRARKLIIA